MVRTSIFLVGLALLTSLASCTTFPSSAPAPTASASGPRTIVLGGQTVSEANVGGFISWYCKDFVDNDRILVEVGFFGDPTLEGLGFILYDG